MATTRIAVWDWPVRITHWALALGFAALWWTGETGRMDWHVRVGIALVGLVTFRILWGVFGSSTARFAGFVRGPGEVARYAAGLLRRKETPAPIGHNPMGGWSIVAMLALLAAELGLGLFAEDTDGMNSGPLASRVSYEIGTWAGTWHHRLFNALLVLVALHLAAVAFYLVARRENLVGPMLGGSRLAPAETAPMRPGRWWALALCVGLACAAMWLAWSPPR